jgi:hypothetical protein
MVMAPAALKTELVGCDAETGGGIVLTAELVSFSSESGVLSPLSSSSPSTPSSSTASPSRIAADNAAGSSPSAVAFFLFSLFSTAASSRSSVLPSSEEQNSTQCLRHLLSLSGAWADAALPSCKWVGL